VLLNDGRGGFPAGNQTPYPAGSSPQSVVLADVHGKGFLDLVVVNSGELSVGVFLNEGGTGGAAGTFQAMVPYGGKGNPSSVAVGHFDQNPGLDLVVTDMNVNGWVSVLPNAGSGTFPAHNDFQTETGGDPWAVAVANFNGGALDLVVVNHATGSVNLLRGDSNGGFQAQPAVPVGKQPTSVAVGPARGVGGKQYVFVTNSGSGSVSVLQYANPNLSPAYDPLELPGMSPRRVVARDVNRDDNLDLVITDGDDPGTVSVLLGNGDGTFQLPPTVIQTGGVQPRAVAVADMNGDGLPDIVVANDSGTVNVLTAHCMP
jgi:FG-GAP-like repeat